MKKRQFAIDAWLGDVSDTARVLNQALEIVTYI